MSEILIGKVKVNNNLVYTEEIINLLMLGNSSRHQLYVDSLESGPITFRKTETIYSAQFQDHHWKINKKETRPQKLYVIDEDTTLSCGDVIMTFQKIKEDQLEVVKDTTPMTRRQNISDLLAESKEADEKSYNPAAKSFLAKMKTSLSKKPNESKEDKKSKKIKKVKIENTDGDSLDETKPNILINLPSTLLQFSCTYFVIIHLDKISNTLKISNEINKLKEVLNKALITYLPLEKFEGLLNTLTSKLPIKFDSSSFLIIKSSIIEIISEFFFFLLVLTLFKILQSILFGGQLSYLISGVSISGNGLTKRIKSLGREILSLVLFPLNVFNPFGLIPLKSLPDFICRVKLVRGSLFRVIFGGIFNVAITLGLLISPFFINKQYSEGNVSIAKTNNDKKPDVGPISFQVLNNNSIELMLPSDYSIESQEIKNKIPITYLSTGTSKAKFSSINLPVKLEDTFLFKYPLSLVFYPALYFKNKIKDNDLFYQSTKKRRNIERQRLVYSTLILSKNINSLKHYLKTNGPFFWGSSNLRVKLKEILPLNKNSKVYRGDIDSIPSVILQASSTLYFFQFNDDANILFSIEFDELNDAEKSLISIFDPIKNNQNSAEPQLESIPGEKNNSVLGIPEDLTKNAMEKIEKLKKSLSL